LSFETAFENVTPSGIGCTSNSGIVVVITKKLQTMTQSKSSFLTEKQRQKKKMTHTQVQTSDFCDSAKMKRLRQIGAEMVQDSKVTT